MDLPDTILFEQDEGILRVSANGGTPELMIPAGEGEQLRGPQVLPDGESVLFTIYKGGANDDSDIALLSLDTLAYEVVFSGGTFPRYASSGHLLFGREPSLLATAFDLQGRETFGTTEIVPSGSHVGP